MGKKISIMLLSLILIATSFTPALAASEPSDNSNIEITQENAENTVVTNEEQNNDIEEPVAPTQPEGSIKNNNNTSNNIVVENTTDPAPEETKSVEEPETVVNTPTITKYEATMPELGKLHITWEMENADNTKIYVSPDRSMEGVSPMSFSKTQVCDITLPNKELWKNIYIRIVPYNGSEKGTLVEWGDDVCKDYRPESVKVTNNTFKYDDGVTLPTITVKDKGGRTIPMTEMKLVKTSSKYPGKNKMTVGYKNKYAGLPNFDVDYTLLPDTPEGLSAWWLEKTKIKLNTSLPRQYYSDGKNYADSVVIECSKSSDFSSPKKLTITKDTSHDKKEFSGLSKNTKYYIRARSIKKTSSGNLYSDWVSITASTTGDAPSTSTSNATTKNIIAKMRKNATFTVKMPSLLSRQDAYDYIRTITKSRPHLAKFKIAYNSKSGECSSISSITFTYDSAKAKKANTLNTKLMKIVKGAKKKKGTRAKVKYVNKQLCKTCSYHWAAYKAKNGYSKYPNAYNAYGCLVNHKAVCSGYSEAFAAIMTELGIPNTYATSPNHRWNKVKIGKTWYHVDVTWNDCTHSNKYLLKKSHPKK